MRLTELAGLTALPASFPLPLDAPFTLAEARAAGVTAKNLTWLVGQGFLRRPVAGVYLATAAGDSVALRCAALRRVVPPDAVVCDRHAGWLLGAEMVLAPGEHLDLRPVSVFLPPGRGRLRHGLSDSGERALLPRDTTEVHGLRVTTPLRTALDLGRQPWPDQSLAAMDQMLRLGTFGVAELVAEVDRFRGARWVRTLRLMAPLADGRAESPPESILRLRWIEAGLPLVEPQLVVRSQDGRFVARLDLGNEENRLGAEYDGVEWHSSPEQRTHDRDRRAGARREGFRIAVFSKESLWGQGVDPEQRLRRFAETSRRHGHEVRAGSVADLGAMPDPR